MKPKKNMTTEGGQSAFGTSFEKTMLWVRGGGTAHYCEKGAKICF